MNTDFQSIKHVMQAHCGHWNLTTMNKKLRQFIQMFVNLTEDHVAFFGSNLTGVHRVRFTSTERFELTENILEIDDLAISRDIKQLPHIGDTWVRGTDGVNLALLYMVHVLQSSRMSSKQIYDTQEAALLILQYKFLSSIITAYFKYPISEEVALATYNSLSGKYLIRRYGSWNAVLHARCRNIIAEEQTHLETIRNFDKDDKIQYMITDIQGRLKSMIINIYSVTMEVKERDDAIRTSNSLIELDGDLTIRDVQRKQADYINYVLTIMPDTYEFIKHELVDVIYASITTMPRKLFVDVLTYASSIGADKRSPPAVLTEKIIIHFFRYIVENPSVIGDLKDYSRVIKTMKDLYTAGKSKNPTVLDCRKLADKVVRKAVPKVSNPATQAGLRIGLILYILMRALTKDHYG